MHLYDRTPGVTICRGRNVSAAYVNGVLMPLLEVVSGDYTRRGRQAWPYVAVHSKKTLRIWDVV